MPSPQDELRRLFASPEPTHTMFAFDGATATAPIDVTRCASNSGVQVAPAVRRLPHATRRRGDIDRLAQPLARAAWPAPRCRLRGRSLPPDRSSGSASHRAARSPALRSPASMCSPWSALVRRRAQLAQHRGVRPLPGRLRKYVARLSHGLAGLQTAGADWGCRSGSHESKPRARARTSKVGPGVLAARGPIPAVVCPCRVARLIPRKLFIPSI